MAISAAHFFRQLGQLFPPGPLWESMGPVFQAVRQVFASELSRVETQYDEWQREIDPRTAVDTLTQWENTLGLGHDGATAERQAKAAAREVAVVATREQDYRAQLTPLLGPNMTFLFRTPAEAAAMGDQKEIYRFSILPDPAGPGYIEAAQAEATAMSRAATKPVIVLSLDSFICDNPYHLVDRDILGV